MGRKKIQIQPIKDDRNRQVTFLKRKHGLMKKAYELSVLCNCEVALFIIPPNNKIIQYSSSDMDQLINEFQQNDLPKEIKSNEDFMENGKNEEDSDNEESLKQSNRAMIQDQLSMNHSSMVSSQPNLPYSYNNTPQSSYTMNQHNMLQIHAQQPMYLFQQHQPTKSTPKLYHSPNTLSPDQSPKSEPGTPEKKRKLSAINTSNSSLPIGLTSSSTLGLPSQFAQNLPTPSTYYPDFYQSNFAMSPIQSGHNSNSANSFMIPTSSFKRKQ